MVPLARWKNTFARRVTLVMMLPVMLLVYFIGGAVWGAIEWTGDLLAAVPNAWRGKSYR